MLVSLIIVFREAMEAGLIVGIVLAATQGVAGRGRWITGGMAAGAAGAGLVAVFAAALANAFEGIGQEIFTAGILCFAAIMLAWHILWMSQHARTMSAELRAVGQAVRLGQRSLAALAVVIAVAVLREGAEVVLFLYGVVAGSGTSGYALLTGGVAGLALAGVLSFLLYRSLIAMPMHRLFSVTNGLIALLAAGMVGQAAATLHSVDLLPGWGEHLWDTSAFLADNSIIGKAFHALIGYSARPSGIQLAAWSATLLGLVLFSRVSSRRTHTVTAAAAVATLLAVVPSAFADDSPIVTFRNHQFEPARLEVSANQKIRLQVKNADATADEFESTDLNREKLVTPGQTVTLFIGPLAPGEYKFFGDFHPDTARGVLVAK